jgi:hypothetical protein
LIPAGNLDNTYNVPSGPTAALDAEPDIFDHCNGVIRCGDTSAGAFGNAVAGNRGATGIGATLNEPGDCDGG